VTRLQRSQLDSRYVRQRRWSPYIPGQQLVEHVDGVVPDPVTICFAPRFALTTPGATVHYIKSGRKPPSRTSSMLRSYYFIDQRNGSTT
jgi:hypothetical protein